KLDARTRLLFALNPATGYRPDFLTPDGGVRDLDEGIDRMLSTPRDRVRAELDRLPEPPRFEAWPGFFASGEVSALLWLGQVFADYHRIAVAPRWSRIVAGFQLERARLAGLLLDGGPALMLANLVPGLAWNDAVLRIPSSAERDLALD